MNIQQIRNFLEESTNFFVNLNEFFEERMLNAQGEINDKFRFISLWLNRVGLENTQHAIVKLEKMAKKLPRAVRGQVERTRTQQIVLESQCKKMVAKTFNLIEQAQEFVMTLNKSAVTNPALDQIYKLLRDHSGLELEDTVLRKKNKSWLNQDLRYEALLLVAANTAKALTESITSAAPQVSSSEQRFSELAYKIAMVPHKNIKPTKTTQQCLGIKDANDIPDSDSLHWQYCPREISQKMAELRTLIQRKEPISKNEVDQLLNFDCPNPGKSYKPWSVNKNFS